VFARLSPHLQPVSFALGGVVYESSEQMESLYFPTTCIDHQGLEAASCECYQVVKTEFDRLLG
jgi:hypothetical protein